MAPALMAMAKFRAGGSRPKKTGRPDCCPKARYQRPDYPGRRPESERNSPLSAGTWAKERSKACWPPADAPTATITGVTVVKLPNEFSNIETGIGGGGQQATLSVYAILAHEDSTPAKTRSIADSGRTSVQFAREHANETGTLRRCPQLEVDPS